MDEVKCVPHYNIRKMIKNDVNDALKVFAVHGLFEAKYSLLTFLEIDSNAFFVAVKNDGQVIGVCGGPFTHPKCAFIGLYGVDKEYMGRGIGSQLFKYVLQNIGDRNCCLFAVPDKINLYKDKLGFKLASGQQMVIYGGKVDKNLNTTNDLIKPKSITDDLLEKIIDYDENIHKFRREKLLSLSLKEPKCLPLAVLDENKKIVGYGCIRENSGGYGVLAPVYADSYEIAQQLIKTLIFSYEIAIKNGVYYYTIDTNQSAINIANHLGLVKHEECPLLFRNSINQVDYSKIYSLLSPNFSL